MSGVERIFEGGVERIESMFGLGDAVQGVRILDKRKPPRICGVGNQQGAWVSVVTNYSDRRGRPALLASDANMNEAEFMTNLVEPNRIRLFCRWHPDVKLCHTTHSRHLRATCKMFQHASHYGRSSNVGYLSRSQFFAFVSTPSSYRRLDIIKQPRGT